MGEIDAVAKGIGQGGLEFILAMTIVALGVMFWLLMKQRDRYDAKQDENKKELLAVYDKHVEQGQQSLEMMQAHKKALERIQRMLPQPRAQADPEEKE